MDVLLFFLPQLQAIADKNKDMVPIGKTSEHIDEEDEDEEDDDADDDDDSDTNDDDELDTDMIDDRDSPDDVRNTYKQFYLNLIKRNKFRSFSQHLEFSTSVKNLFLKRLCVFIYGNFELIWVFDWSMITWPIHIHSMHCKTLTMSFRCHGTCIDHITMDQSETQISRSMIFVL